MHFILYLLNHFLFLYMDKNRIHTNIYIITEEVSSSGISTWNEMILWYIKKTGIRCNLININKTNNNIINSLNNSVIIFNNIASEKIFNKYVLQTLYDNKNLLYMVMHSELSPRNKLFVVLEEYFIGAIAISKKLQQTLQQKYPKKDIIYIPNKINIKAHILDRDDIEGNIEGNNVLSFGFIGRISIEKNIPLLLYSFKKIVDETIDIDFILHIFGDTPNKKYGKYINKLAITLQIDKFIEYHGHVLNKDEIYSNIDILLLPSISEGIPYSLIERTYYGIPAVASNVGSICEVVSDDDGILFDYINYPKIDDMYVNSFSELILNFGFVIENKDKYNYSTNNIKHTCGNNYCPNIIYPDDILLQLPLPVSDINIEMYSNSCDACILLQQNRNRFTSAITTCISKMKYMNIIPIYENFDMSVPIKLLINNVQNIHNIHNIDNIHNIHNIDNIQNTLPDTSSQFTLNTNIGKYGFYSNYHLRSLPYNVTFEIDLIGECTLFICHKNSIMPYISRTVNNGVNNIDFRITQPGYYKIGLQLSMSDSDNNIGIVKNYNILSCGSNMPYKERIFFDIHDMKIINSSRYIDKNEIGNTCLKDILFVVITCDLPKYKENNCKMIDFLPTLNNYNYNYIIVKCTPGKTIYDNLTKTLIIGIDETYENLPRKVINALEWILNNEDFNKFKYIYKLDDDFAPNILSFIPKQYDNYNYYGNFIVNKFVDIWHIGKCNSSELNRNAYKHDFIAPYAGGGYGYMLSKKSLKILVKNKEKFEEYLYEDKAVGDILYMNNIICNKKEFCQKIDLVDNSIRVIGYDFSDNIKGYVIIYTYKKDMLICVIENEILVFQRFYHKFLLNTLNKLDITELECFCNKNYTLNDSYNKSCESINEEVIRISNKSKFKQSGLQLAYPPHQYDYLIINRRCNILPLYIIKRMHLQNMFNNSYKNLQKIEELKNIDYDYIFDYDIVYF